MPFAPRSPRPRMRSPSVTTMSFAGCGQLRKHLGDAPAIVRADEECRAGAGRCARTAGTRAPPSAYRSIGCISSMLSQTTRKKSVSLRSCRAFSAMYFSSSSDSLARDSPAPARPAPRRKTWAGSSPRRPERVALFFRERSALVEQRIAQQRQATRQRGDRRVNEALRNVHRWLPSKVSLNGAQYATSGRGGI